METPAPTNTLPARTGPMVRNPKNIGGSDAAAIVGKDPNKTAYAVAMRILGRIESDDLDGLDHIEFGNEMEGVLARFYERKNRVKLYTPQPLIHRQRPFISVNIDRVREDRLDIGIECKNTGLYGTEIWGEQNTDEVPDRVLLQCQHGMMVRPEIECFHVLRCYGGNQYQQFVVPRNEQLIASLFELECEFYDNLQKGIVPEPDWGHRTTKEAIKRAYKNVVGDTVDMPELLELTEEWRSVADARLALQKREEALKNQIEFKVGNAGIAKLMNGKCWRRKQIERASYVVKASSYIECRLVNEP